LPGVLFDANVYRKTGWTDFAALLELERKRQVYRYAEPFVLTELLAHLADATDKAFGTSQAAVVRMFQRCSGDGPCGMIRDSESRLVEAITGKVLEKHDAHTDQLRLLLMHVGHGFPLSAIESQLRTIEAHVAAIEEQWADEMGRLQLKVGGILAEEEGEQRRTTRLNAMRTHASEAPRLVIAEKLLRDACQAVGRALPDPPPAELVARVRRGAVAQVEFRAQALAKSAFEAAEFSTSRMRNLVWDERLAFNIGQTIGTRPLWLVTDDRAFARVAEATGHADRVLKPAAYTQLLGQGAVPLS
jgi:hypothetical protein